MNGNGVKSTLKDWRFWIFIAGIIAAGAVARERFNVACQEVKEIKSIHASDVVMATKERRENKEKLIEYSGEIKGIREDIQDIKDAQQRQEATLNMIHEYLLRNR
jgi:hypothetical protein